MAKQDSLGRRHFLKQTAALGAGILASGPFVSINAAESPNKKIVVGVMGTNGRGMAHIDAYLSLPNTEVAYVCDVDSRAIEKAAAAVVRRNQKRPQGVSDFRQILDDPAVDVLSVAAPNHWHAPATILACSAGKHVYVEKPGSHNPREGEMMVAAARKHNRVVQMGNQRRSWPHIIEAIHRLRSGEIGRVLFARTWYNNLRPSIGLGKQVPPPDWLDYTLWQGPAPDKPFKDNLLHYNWHWHWHWGNGELGNNGIHALDVARWGLDVECPTRVTCGGGRYYYKDDQETPDTYVTTYDFGDKAATWESHSCHPRGFEGAGFGINFHGEKGSIVIAGNDVTIYDQKGTSLETLPGRGGDAVHFANFLQCIREGGRPNSDIEEGQKSTLLCHLGNIAYRTGRTINLDPKARTIVGGDDGARFWTRDYRPGWQPRV
ncbi:MAG: Gfo/Idh/MocA family oxidoreductase [Verrucomicrobia bacterium]|nr:Gfo/Idh/MocA family oxidoreductase [Verrucomicrobiota bacterium]